MYNLCAGALYEMKGCATAKTIEFYSKSASLSQSAKDLNTLTPDQYRRWVTKISYYGWRKNEPLEFEISEPKLLNKMLALHLDDLQYSKEELTKMFGLNALEFDKIYLQSFQNLHKYLNKDNKVRKLKISF